MVRIRLNSKGGGRGRRYHTYPHLGSPQIHDQRIVGWSFPWSVESHPGPWGGRAVSLSSMKQVEGGVEERDKKRVWEEDYHIHLPIIPWHNPSLVETLVPVPGPIENDVFPLGSLIQAIFLDWGGIVVDEVISLEYCFVVRENHPIQPILILELPINLINLWGCSQHLPGVWNILSTHSTLSVGLGTLGPTILECEWVNKIPTRYSGYETGTLPQCPSLSSPLTLEHNKVMRQLTLKSRAEWSMGISSNAIYLTSVMRFSMIGRSLRG